MVYNVKIVAFPRNTRLLFGPLHASIEASDQTGYMFRLIWTLVQCRYCFDSVMMRLTSSADKQVSIVSECVHGIKLISFSLNHIRIHILESF